MRAETILPGESREEYQRRLENWLEDYGAETDAERYLIGRAVKASWKLDRSDRIEVSLATRLMNGVEKEAEKRQAEELDQLAPRLIAGEDLRAVVRQLRAIPAGCSWMLEQWGIFSTHLHTFASLFTTQRHLALHLLGKRMEDLFRGDPVVTRWVLLMTSAARRDREPITTEEADELFAEFRPEGMHPSEYDAHVGDLLGLMPDPLEARALLRALIAATVAELEENLKQVQALAQRELALDLECAEIDLGTPGVRLLNYAASNDRSYHSVLRRLEAQKKTRRPGPGRGPGTGPGPGEGEGEGEGEGPTTAEAEPELTNEPISGPETPAEAEPELTNEPISGPETPAEPEPELTNEPISGPETPAEPEPELTNEPISSRDTPAEAEPELTNEPISSRETPAEAEAELTNEPISGRETPAEAEPELTNEPISSRETPAEPDTTEPELSELEPEPEPDDAMTEAELMKIAPEVAILRRLSREIDAFYGYTSSIRDPAVRAAPDRPGDTPMVPCRPPPPPSDPRVFSPGAPET